ncbi:unnamed protein product [Clonostachys rhizophaga]|uniref:Uncharacterized protein n=1 Tax=Clonostachys rhizophaga TaxID=160324 RepID=A0A9N9VSD0_9HYPO|nr:unnamed protein product [Clonostachys rhizophaga]
MLKRSLLRASSRGALRYIPATAPAVLRGQARTHRFASSAPATIIDRDFWRNLVPKPLRKEYREAAAKKGPKKQWNPATFFIVMFLLIGSMAIQMIAVRNSFQRYMRSAEIKIAQLREVVERIQNGETVDVEAALGTGNAQKEADWEEVLRSIERGDAPKKASKPEKSKQSATPKEEPAPAQKTKPAEQQEQQAPSSTSNTTGKPSAGFGNFF